MGFVTGIMVYLIAWWLVFFMALPLGVKPQGENPEDRPEGTAPSAPARPMLLMKMGVASVGAFIIWGVLYWMIDGGMVQLRPVS